jgi:hypothetical protein
MLSSLIEKHWLGLHCVPVAKAGLGAVVRPSGLTFAYSKLTNVYDLELAGAVCSLASIRWRVLLSKMRLFHIFCFDFPRLEFEVPFNDTYSIRSWWFHWVWLFHDT